MKRYLAAATPSSVQLALTQPDGKLTLAARLNVQGASDLCFGHDGQALYVALAKEKSLKVIAVAAKGGPAVLPSSYRMGTGAFVELACRSGVPVVAALQRKAVLLYDARVPTALAELASIPLPDDAVAAALSPDGESLAVLTKNSNALLLLSLKTHNVVATLPLLDGETVPLLRDLVYAPAGNELWVVSGNSANSVVAGTRPTRVHRVAVHGISLSRIGSAVIGPATGPGYLAVSQREAVMAAAAIRSTASKATLLLSSVDDGASRLLRFDLDGKAVPLIEDAEGLSHSLVSHDQKWAYSAAWSEKGLRLISASLDGVTKDETEIGGGKPAGVSSIPLSLAP